MRDSPKHGHPSNMYSTDLLERHVSQTVMLEPTEIVKQPFPETDAQTNIHSQMSTVILRRSALFARAELFTMAFLSMTDMTSDKVISTRGVALQKRRVICFDGSCPFKLT